MPILLQIRLFPFRKPGIPNHPGYLKCSSRCDTAIRIAYLRVIYIPTWLTYIFFHLVTS